MVVTFYDGHEELYHNTKFGRDRTTPAVGAQMWCLLPAGCHGNLPVLNLLSASVAKNQNFRPCRKNYALDRKIIDIF